MKLGIPDLIFVPSKSSNWVYFAPYPLQTGRHHGVAMSPTVCARPVKEPHRWQMHWVPVTGRKDLCFSDGIVVFSLKKHVWKYQLIWQKNWIFCLVIPNDLEISTEPKWMWWDLELTLFRNITTFRSRTPPGQRDVVRPEDTQRFAVFGAHLPPLQSSS